MGTIGLFWIEGDPQIYFPFIYATQRAQRLLAMHRDFSDHAKKRVGTD